MYFRPISQDSPQEGYDIDNFPFCLPLWQARSSVAPETIPRYLHGHTVQESIADVYTVKTNRSIAILHCRRDSTGAAGCLFFGMMNLKG